MSFLRKLFGVKPKVNLQQLFASEKVLVVDVRTPAEYKQGHVKGATNVPLNKLSANVVKLKGKEPIVLCCASGMRSGQATSLLKSQGFTRVYNGGSWQKVNRMKN